MKYKWIRETYLIYFYGGSIRKKLQKCHTILELGCGKESIIVKADINKTTEVTAVDIFEPYIEAHKVLNRYSHYILGDVTELDFKPKQFDAVVCMDLIEHIDRQKVLDSGLIDKMKVWGKSVYITTPNGYIENKEIDGNKYQAHLSGWTIEDFKGYKVSGLSGAKFLRTYNAEIKYSPFLFWGVISALSQSITKYIPRMAFHLMAVYEE